MLSITGLSKIYANGTRALDQVNLEIGAGMFGLLGPNGAGKSTLMRTLATLQLPDTGSIQFNGIQVLSHPQELRQQLGYLPQEFGVYPRISALHLLDHLAILKGLHDKAKRQQQVHALLEQTNLYAVRKKAVQTFSGGMRQRFGIAQALLGDPRLIIVDEPTAGLDPEERSRFLNLLSEIGQDRVVLLSTHIVDDVRDLCPRMAILATGRILAHGVPGELMQALSGRIWMKTIQRDELVAARDMYNVISSRLFAGETQIRVFAEDRPGDAFIAQTPLLEDVYFATLAEHRGASAHA